MKVTVAKDFRGQEEIHKAGCSDLKRRNRPYRMADALTMEATSLTDIYRAYWECIDIEAVENGNYKTVEEAWYAWRGEFTVKPCAKGLEEMADPSEPATARASKREAKQDLARRLVMAAGDILESADGSEAFLAGMSKAEAARALANWLHHIPARSEDGTNWAVGTLPKPERSDWR